MTFARNALPCSHCGCSDVLVKGFVRLYLQCANAGCGIRTSSDIDLGYYRNALMHWNRRLSNIDTKEQSK